jgi:hypothetical protein
MANHNFLSAIYIAQNNLLFLHTNTPMSYIQQPPSFQWNRIVYCPFCNWMATLKPTKTNKLMLRCNNCTLLIFANGRLSQQKLLMLPNYQFSHHHTLY